jgi:hypothetical protein
MMSADVFITVVCTALATTCVWCLPFMIIADRRERRLVRLFTQMEREMTAYLRAQTYLTPTPVRKVEGPELERSLAPTLEFNAVDEDAVTIPPPKQK